MAHVKTLTTRLRGLLRSTAGETIVEALVSVLILALTLLFFATTIKTATDMSLNAREKFSDYREQISLAETGPWNESGTVSIGGQSVDVFYNVSSTEDGILSYRLDGGE